MSTPLLLIPLVAMLAVAAGIDLRKRIIPNWLTLTIALSGLLAAVFWPTPLVPWWQSLLGLAVGLLINLPLFVLQIRGGGDVKLFAAVGTWIGPWPVVYVFVVATVVAMFVAVLQAVLNRKLKPVLSSTAHLAVGLAHGTRGGLAATTDNLGRPVTADRHLPYAVPIMLAVLTMMFMES